MAGGRGGEPPRQRSMLRAVAVPAEHGGWGLTAEPVLLGLLVAPSVAGAALGLAAVMAFLARTPLRLLGVDLHRHRRLPRTQLAARVGAAEASVVAALIAGVAVLAGHAWWVPLLAAVPLVAVEAVYDVRSRSRRLVPELCGAVGIAAVAPAVARAGGASWTIAIGLWVVLAARSLASIPFARAQVERAKGRAIRRAGVDVAQALGTVAVVVGWAVGAVPLAGLIAVAFLAVGQAVWIRVRPPRIAVTGVVQLVAGLGVVVAAAAPTRFG